MIPVLLLGASIALSSTHAVQSTTSVYSSSSMYAPACVTTRSWGPTKRILFAVVGPSEVYISTTSRSGTGAALKPGKYRLYSSTSSKKWYVWSRKPGRVVVSRMK